MSGFDVVADGTAVYPGLKAILLKQFLRTRIITTTAPWKAPGLSESYADGNDDPLLHRERRRA